MNFLRKLLYLMAVLLLPCASYADWQPVQTIYQSDNIIEAPLSLGVDEDGNAVAVGSLNSFNVQASTRPFNGMWTLPDLISILPPSSLSPNVAVDGEGNAIAVWRDGVGIRSSKYTFGGVWSAPDTVDTGNTSNPIIKMNTNGQAILIWTKTTGVNSFFVRYATTTFDSSWSAVTDIASHTALQSINLGISENGDGIATIFSPVVLPNGILQVRNIPFSGPPPPLVQLSNAAPSFPSVAVDPIGNGFVVWSESANTLNSAVYIIDEISGIGSWFLKGTIPGTVAATHPNVAVDAEGNAVAVWTQGLNQILGARLPFNTGTWQPTSALSAGPGVDWAKVAIDGLGNAVVVWQTTALTGNVQAKTLPADTLTWGPLVNLFAPTPTFDVRDSTPVVAINAAGNVIAGWGLFDAGLSLYYYQTAANSIPSTETSTLVATPTVAYADGVDSATLTVTVLDGNGMPIVGNTITLTLGGSAFSPAVVGITNVQGQVAFTVRDNTAENVTFTATDNQTSIVIGTVDVNFIEPIDPLLSTAVAVPTIVEATGSDFSTITVTLRDSGGIALSGRTVQLTQTGSSVTTPPGGPVGTAMTNAAGEAVFTVTNTTVQPVTYTATDITNITDPIVVTQQPVVNFIPPKTFAGNSSVVAVPTSVEADGIDTSTITVTLRNANNNLVEGHTVQLTQNVGGNSVITTVNAVTNALGQAFFTVTDLVVEDVTYTARDVTDNVVVTQKAVVRFTELIPDPDLSSIVANPTFAFADGVDFSTVTVTLFNKNGVEISGHDVSLGQDGSSSITPLVGTTDVFGKVNFTVKDLVSELVIYTATDLTSGVEITGTASVNFLPRVTDAFVSTVNANPTSVFADGVSFSTITVRLKNINGAPVVGHNVSLVADGGSSIISPPSGPSDVAGIVTFTITNTAVESVTYTATDLNNGVIIDQTATVNFTPPPPLPPSNFEGIRVVNKFATQKEFTDILTWTPSPDPSVVSYRIYVNGVLERTIPALGPYRAEFIHRCDNLTYVYRLVAVSDQGVESSPLFVTLPH